MNSVPQDQPLACTPAYIPTSANVPSPRFKKSVFRWCCSSVSMSPGFLGNAVCVGIWLRCLLLVLPHLALTKMSGFPSTLTSATSTPIAELLSCLFSFQ